MRPKKAYETYLPFSLEIVLQDISEIVFGNFAYVIFSTDYLTVHRMARIMIDLMNNCWQILVDHYLKEPNIVNILLQLLQFWVYIVYIFYDAWWLQKLTFFISIIEHGKKPS